MDIGILERRGFQLLEDDIALRRAQILRDDHPASPRPGGGRGLYSLSQKGELGGVGKEELRKDCGIRQARE